MLNKNRVTKPEQNKIKKYLSEFTFFSVRALFMLLWFFFHLVIIVFRSISATNRNK